MDDFLIALVVGVIAILIIWGSVVAERKRRVALEGVAKRLGLAFDPGTDRRLHHEYGHSLFRRGHSRQSTNNLYGTLRLAGHRIQVRMGDYKYVTGHGKHRQVHRLSYAAFLLPFAGLPQLLIRREGVGDKLLGGMGFDDIDFESEEFSRKFWVKSEKKKFAYDVIHPKMMEFLLEGPSPHVEIVRDVCLVLERRRRWEPDTFEGAPGWFQAFLELWPDHLVDRLQPRKGMTR